MKYTLQKIATSCSGRWIGQPVEVHQVAIDSRTMFNPNATLFVALRGVNHDGHAYIEELYKKGVRAFLVDADTDVPEVWTVRYPEAGFVLCTNSLVAIQELAQYHRLQFHGTVVAITGSNGKTVTKEWIAQLCPPEVKLFRSPKSYNSQVGVALSLLMLQGDEQLAIIEAGISQPGEMERLARMIRPQIGIFTNLADAHQEYFTNKEEKLTEKLRLFADAKSVIYNASESLNLLITKQLKCDLLAVTPDRYDLSNFPFPDRASHENVTQALALYQTLGYDVKPLLSRLSQLQGVAMRLELKDGIGGCKLLNDSYNSDINSLSLALDYLTTIAGDESKVLILSDIAQSGLPPQKLYDQVAELLRIKGVDRLIGIGPELTAAASLFTCETEFYRDTEAFLRTCNRTQFQHVSILIKGCRVYNFERISRALEQKTHTTVLEVSLDRMIHNLNCFRSKLCDGVGLMAMVKASGYGNGGYEVASMLQHQGVHFLAVAFADEGVVLRQAGITMPIVVLNADGDSFELMLEYQLEPEIYSLSSLRDFAHTVRRHGETAYPIHLKIDSGMHRLGFEPAQIEQLITSLRQEPELYIRTVFTHLAGSDDAEHDDFTREQIARFVYCSDQICAAFPGVKILRHASNSAAIERFPEAQFDLVRLGIGLYGVSATESFKLLPVSSLKSRIVQIKEIEPGETVGYGRHGEVLKPMRTATVPIGYADGLNRRLSRGAWSMVVNGRLAPIVGNICMDTCMLDITEIDAQEGDTVVVFGEGAPITRMADVLETIPYEIMTSISTRVKRIFTKE